MKKTTLSHQKTQKWKLINEKQQEIGKHTGQGAQHKVGLAVPKTIQTSHRSPGKGSEKPGWRSLGPKSDLPGPHPSSRATALGSPSEQTLLITLVPQHPDSGLSREVTGNHKPEVRPKDKKLHRLGKVAIAEPRGLESKPSLLCLWPVVLSTRATCQILGFGHT